MQGSNDGSSWTTIDTVTSQTGWAANESRNFDCDTKTTAYRFFKLVITANNTDTYTDIQEINLNGTLSESFTEIGPHDLTSTTSHSPFVVSSSSDQGTNYSWKAFDGKTDKWLANAATGILKIDLGDGNSKVVGSYSVRTTLESPSETDRSPKNWTLEGSDDNSSWTTLDTVTNQTSWAKGEIRYFECDSVLLFRYIRINVTANDGDPSYLCIEEFSLIESNLPSGDILVLSDAILYTVGKDRTVADNLSNWLDARGDIGPHDLTSYTSHSPIVISASSEEGTNYAWKAFDNSDTSKFLTNAAGGVGWLKVDWGAGNSKIIHDYAIQLSADGATFNRGPKDFTLQGSNDDSNWDVIDTVVNQTGWSNREKRFFTCDVELIPYRYLKLNITANNGDALYTDIGELFLFSSGFNYDESLLFESTAGSLSNWDDLIELFQPKLQVVSDNISNWLDGVNVSPSDTYAASPVGEDVMYFYDVLTFDFLVFSSDITKTISDLLSLTDSKSFQLTGNLQETSDWYYEDILGLLDAIQLGFLNDTPEANDDLSSWLDAVGGLLNMPESYDSNMYNWADAITLTPGNALRSSDSFSLSDTSSAVVATTLMAQSSADSLSFSDGKGLQSGIGKVVGDFLYFYERVIIRYDDCRVGTDILTLSDLLNVIMQQMLISDDIISLSDACNVFNNVLLAPALGASAWPAWLDEVEILLSTSDLAYLRRFLNDVVRY
jgi:hypothetical protein